MCLQEWREDQLNKEYACQWWVLNEAPVSKRIAACNNIIQFMKTTCKLRHHNPKLEALSF